MTDLASDLQKAIAERNFFGSSHLLGHIAQKGEVSILERFRETDLQNPHQTLELRDHIMKFLGLWELYFAIDIPSYELMKTLQNKPLSSDIQHQTLEYIRELLDERDTRVDQSCINIDSIGRSQYAVILPQILSMRTEEFENCIIPYLAAPTRLFCIANLVKTHYGHKIVNATLNAHSFDLVVGMSTFSKISESLCSAGLDINSMLQPIDPNEWTEIECKSHEQHPADTESRELRLLHRIKSARTEIFLDSFRKQVAALDTILSAKTQVCNDVLMTIASDITNPMRRRAINALGQTGDSSTMDFLSKILNDSDEGSRVEATRAYSKLASQRQWSGVHHHISPSSEKIPLLDIAKINQILNTLIAKSLPTEAIDDTLGAVVAQGGPQAVDILLRLLLKPQTHVRQAVIRASRRMEKDLAAKIIKHALSDESPEVVDLAERELENRWSDDIW
ncbi:HEAT repeat domain-containing protein [Candidatus Thorarchaeota archaeon]|nr:MAG: HEAT repeat domain-containing protein [Candidatus Thorarchaeota archaeon]